MKSKLIVFEGLDKTGKTTVSQRVAEKMNNSIWTRQPGCEILSKENSFFKDLRKFCKENSDVDVLTKFFAFQMDRVEQINKIIIPSLNEGKTIICDRWSLSTYAYQYYGEELYKIIDKKTFKFLIEIANKNIVPNNIIYFSKQLKRKNEDKDYFDKKNKKYFNRVKKGYKEVLKDFENVLEVYPKNSIEETANYILEKIKE